MESASDLFHFSQFYVPVITYKVLSQTLFLMALFCSLALRVLSPVNGNSSETRWKNRKKDLTLNLTFGLNCFFFFFSSFLFFFFTEIFSWALAMKIPFKSQLQLFRIYYLSSFPTLQSSEFLNPFISAGRLAHYTLSSSLSVQTESITTNQ